MAFPYFLLKVDNTDELKFNVRLHTTTPTTCPDFDESSANVYTVEVHTLLFNRPEHPDLQEVPIVSTLKIKPVKYLPSHLTQQSIKYVLKAISYIHQPKLSYTHYP